MDHRRVAEGAVRYHGVLHTDLLAAAGVSGYQRRREVRSGRWRLLPNGVPVLAGVPDSVAMLATGALVKLPHGVLSHDTAGWVYGVEGVDEWSIHVTVEYGTSARSAGATVHRSSLQPVDLTRRRGFPVTTLERTLVDLGLTMAQRDLRRAMEGRLIARATTFERLETTFARVGGQGRPGTVRAGRALAALDGNPPSESELEAMFLDLLDAAGIPRPELQVRVDGVTGEKGRVDGMYVEQGVIIELDGRRFHSRIEAFERDRRRDQQAIRRGLRPLRFTHRQITHEPQDVVDVLRDVLGT